MGRVILIGAGPGDPELLTLKAARALRSADVILIDDLVNRGCLAHARSDARVIEVGKRGGCKSTPQQFIERMMVQYAKNGNVVPSAGENDASRTMFSRPASVAAPVVFRRPKSVALLTSVMKVAAEDST